MKRKLISIFLLLFVTVLLTGCDFFGAQTTVTTAATTVATTAATTAATTTVTTGTTTEVTTGTTTEVTTSTTTEVTTSTTTTATVTTTAAATVTFTVVFLDSDGVTVLKTQTVAEGSDATAPADPTKASDANNSYTFNGWDTDFTNVTGNLTVTATYTATAIVNQYIVTFYDDDGVTILKTQTVDEGSDATAPADPTKPDDGDYTYTFNSWDTDFTNVTGDLTVTAIYDVTYNSTTTFTHEDLQGLVVMFGDFGENPDPADVDALIDQLIQMSGIVSEHELFDLINNGLELFGGLQAVQSADDLQTWYASTKTLGFDKDTLINILYSQLIMSLSNQQHDSDNNIQDLNDQIAGYQQDILDNQAEQAQLTTDVSDYCLTTAYPDLCQDYFDKQVALSQMDNDYNENTYSDKPDSWNMDIYWQLEDAYNGYLFSLITSNDPVEAQNYLDTYNSIWDNLPAEQQDLYQPYIDSYKVYTEARLTFDNTDYSLLKVNLDSNSQYIRVVLDHYLFGYYDNSGMQVLGYMDYIQNISFDNWLIVEANMQIAELTKNQLMISSTLDFIVTPDGEIATKAVMSSLYDGLDSMILLVDDNIFNLVMDFVHGEVNPMDLATPENIALYSGEVAGLLDAFNLTLDPTDFLNMKLLGMGIFESALNQSTMTDDEIQAQLSTISSVVDYYLPIATSTFTELIGFVNSIDINKAQAILDISKILTNPKDDMTNEIDIAIYLSKAYDVILGDDSFDVYNLFQNLTEIYFDVTSNFSADPTYITHIQDQVGLNITAILSSIDVIKDLDPSLVSPSDVEMIYDVAARIQAVAMYFQKGFETADLPIEAYQDYFLNNFIRNYLGEFDPSARITELMDILGTTSEEDTFYALRSIFQYAMGFGKVESFADIQNLVLNLENFGFTQENIIDITMSLINKGIEKSIQGREDWNNWKNNVQSNIDDFSAQLLDFEDALDLLDSQVQTEIDALSPDLQSDATQYWSMFKQNINDEIVFNNLHDDLAIALTNSEASFDIDNLDTIIAEMYINEMGDPIAYEASLAIYANYYNSVNPDIQTMMDDLVNKYANKEMSTDNLVPMETLIANNSLYLTFYNLVSSYYSTYSMTYGSYLDVTITLQNWMDEMDEVMSKIQPAIITQAFLSNPANLDLTKSVMGIVIDDFQNMIGQMPADSFEILPSVIQYFRGMVNPDMHDDYPQPLKGEIPFEKPIFEPTPEEIFGLIQDASALIKLRGASIDASDSLIIQQFIQEAISAYVASLNLDAAAETALITSIQATVNKYISFADITLTEFTDLLDGITLTQVEDVMDYITIIEQGQMSVYGQIIYGAQLFESIVDINTFDLYQLKDMLLEVYYDVNYQFDYDPANLVALQDAWGVYFDDTLNLIASVATLDPNSIDPVDMGDILEIPARLDALRMLFDYPEGIFEGTTFGYMTSDFENLIYMMFDNVNPEDVQSKINDLVSVFGLNEEQTYYMLLGIGSAVGDFNNINSIADLQSVYQSLLTIGLDNQEIAEYLVNAFMVFGYPNLATLGDTSQLQNELNELLLSITDSQDNMDNLEATVQATINTLSEEAIPMASDLWDAHVTYQEALAKYQSFYNIYFYSEDFDPGLYYQFRDANNFEEWYKVDDMMNQFGDQGWIYQQMYSLETDKNNAYNDLDYYKTAFSANFPTEYVDMTNTFVNYAQNLAMTYGGYYSNYYELNISVEQLQDRFNGIQNFAWIYSTLDEFLSDPNNILATSDVLVIFLDEFESMAVSSDLAVLDNFMMMLNTMDFESLSVTDVSNNLIDLGMVFSNLFSTIDPTERVFLNQYVDELMSVALDNIGITDPDVLAAKKVALTGIVNSYFMDLWDMPGTIGTFLQSMDVSKTQALLDQIAILNTLDFEDESTQYLQVITVSNIIYILVGDNTLDYATLIDTGFGLVYNILLEEGLTVGDSSDVVIPGLLTQIDQIIIQAGLVGQFDPNNLTPDQLMSLQALKDSVDSLGMFVNGLLHGNEIPV